MAKLSDCHVSLAIRQRDHVMVDLPPKQLDLLRNVETLETPPEGTEHIIRDAHCLSTIA